MKFPKAHFVSDLHLFSKRSSGPQVQRAIEAAVARSDTFVLGGDIFDFRWSELESVPYTNLPLPTNREVYNTLVSIYVKY